MRPTFEDAVSEVALALKTGTPVWCWASWTLTPPRKHEVQMPRVFEKADDLIEALDAVLSNQQAV